MLATRILTTQAQEKLDFAAAALGLAGHEVSDPALVDLLERQAMDEITIEEALLEARRYLKI